MPKPSHSLHYVIGIIARVGNILAWYSVRCDSFTQADLLVKHSLFTQPEALIETPFKGGQFPTWGGYPKINGRFGE